MTYIFDEDFFFFYAKLLQHAVPVGGGNVSLCSLPTVIKLDNDWKKNSE